MQALAVQPCQEIARRGHGDLQPGSFGVRSQMWTQHHVLQFENRIVYRDRLHLHNIQGRSHDLSAGQRRAERLLIYHRTPGAIYQNRRLLQLVRTDHMAGVVGKANVQTDKIGLLQ